MIGRRRSGRWRRERKRDRTRLGKEEKVEERKEEVERETEWNEEGPTRPCWTFIHSVQVCGYRDI